MEPMEDMEKAQHSNIFEMVEIISPERYDQPMRLGCCRLCKLNYMFTSVSHIYKHLQVAHPEIAKKQEKESSLTKLYGQYLELTHCKAECVLCHSVFLYRTSKDLLRHLKIVHDI